MGTDDTQRDAANMTPNADHAAPAEPDPPFADEAPQEDLDEEEVARRVAQPGANADV